MTTFAIQERAVSENPDAGPQGKGWQTDIAFTLEARNKVQAVAYSDKAVKARAKEPTGGPVNHIAANDNHNPQALRFLSVCSGIEAASVAWPQWRAIGYAEIEPYPAFVLNYHYGAGRPVFMPDPGENQLKKKDRTARLAAIRTVSKLPTDGTITNWGDFTKIDTTELGRVDILCGGTPCQAFSVAGLRRSLDDARGNLSLAFVELAHELAGNGRTAGNGLRNVIWENVVGVLSTKDNAFGCFLAGLVGADAPIEPIGRWTNAGMVSGPKGRAAWRVLDAQYFGLAQRRRRVIVVADFGNGADPAAVLFEQEGVRRHSPPSRETGEGVAGATKGGTRGCGWPADVAPTLNAAFGDKQGLEDQHALSGAGLFVPHAVGVTGEVAHTLKAEGADASEDGTGRGTPIVAQTVAIRGRDGGATAELGGEVATALRASQGGGDKPHVLTSAVRRLTPVECERLMGFPDGYTAIPWRGKPADQCPDGPRYKALGNSWAVPLFAWLGRRIDRYMPATTHNKDTTIAHAA